MILHFNLTLVNRIKLMKILGLGLTNLPPLNFKHEFIKSHPHIRSHIIITVAAKCQLTLYLVAGDGGKA